MDWTTAVAALAGLAKEAQGRGLSMVAAVQFCQGDCGHIVWRSGMPSRLTPLEVERCFGFPDNHTAISYRGKPAADGPRYKALGNSMAVPVMRWIGQRIEAVDQITTTAADAPQKGE